MEVKINCTESFDAQSSKGSSVRQFRHARNRLLPSRLPSGGMPQVNAKNAPRKLCAILKKLENIQKTEGTKDHLVTPQDYYTSCSWLKFAQ